jgi:hypothetical protein
MAYNGSSDGRVGFVLEPHEGRGTIGLIYSCLFAIFLSTYTVLRQSIPGKRLTTFQSMRRKIVVFLFAVIFPETLCCRALYELSQAKKISDSKKWRQKHPTWTITHSFFALMGGLVVEDADGNLYQVAQVDWFKYQINDATLPSEEQILDLSKANTVAKAITFVQILWVLAQIIGRLAQNLTVSTLEVATVAYIFCATITYIAWWNKPLDIAAPLTVSATYRHRAYNLWPKRRSEADAFLDSIVNSADRWATACVFFAIFGGIHVAAWEYPFPTVAESRLWRASAIIMTLLPFISFGTAGIDRLFAHDVIFFENVAPAIMATYALAHMFIICEVFVCLRSAPLGIYREVNWTSLLPHF